MKPQRNQEKDSNSGVNLVWNLGVVDPGKKFRFFQANFLKTLICSGNFTKNRFLGKNWPFTANSWQIILFLFKGHHFRTYFLCIIRYNNIARPPAAPRTPCPKSLGIATPSTPQDWRPWRQKPTQPSEHCCIWSCLVWCRYPDHVVDCDRNYHRC